MGDHQGTVRTMGVVMICLGVMLGSTGLAMLRFFTVIYNFIHRKLWTKHDAACTQHK